MSQTKRIYNGWIIESQGGYISIKRFEASKDDKWHWAFRLKDCKVLCDKRDRGEQIEELYLNPLYS